MQIQPSLLWNWNRTIDRAPYLLIGALMFVVKFGIDWTIANLAFHQSWSPLNYLIWPNDRVVGVLELGDPERWFSLTMLLVSLPFIWIGVMLTLHRLRAAGLPLVLILLFFMPLVNLLLFLVLVLLPTRDALSASSPDDASARAGAPEYTGITVGARRQRRRAFEPLRDMHRSIVLESYWRSGIIALAVTVPLAVLAVWIGAQVFQSYGFSLFVGAPFALGMISVLLFGFSRRQSFGSCMLVAFSAATLAGLAVILVALEGLICLIMAAPIAYALVFQGALVGYAIQVRPWLNDQAVAITLAVLLTLPALMAAESADEPEPIVRSVQTEVIIAAPPSNVWPHVVAFPPLDEPDDWFFRTGVAYPQRAEIHGTGVGAVRHCVFSTGTFVEPIEVWDAPTLLRFSVVEQPEPMEEWSPYQIHPAHLDHYLRSVKGQFSLEALPDGRTRLVGTTWYSNRMWPAPYWNQWSDYVIHRIHSRVLTHIQALAEAS
jgi:uncharacterized membrane protein YhaH (DUF805 family)